MDKDKEGKENKRVMINEMRELQDLVENDMHGYIQRDLIMFEQCKPSEDAIKKWSKKNPGAYYRAKYDAINTEQKKVAGGFGNPTTKNLTINLSSLGLKDKQDKLREMTKEMQEIGERMGYGKKVVEAEAEDVPNSNKINNI